MANKCVYCNGKIVDSRAIDVCDTCGKSVWGEKMFRAILDNGAEAKERGDSLFS